MNPTARIAAFALALLATFGGGVAIGAAAGPLDDAPAPPSHNEHAP